MGTKFDTYHHSIAVSTALNCFGPRLRYYNSNICQNGFGMQTVKSMEEELLEQVCMFVFLFKSKTWGAT
jgi:hypothetical protein